MGSASPMSQGCGGAWQKGFTLVLGMRLKDYDSPPPSLLLPVESRECRLSECPTKVFANWYGWVQAGETTASKKPTVGSCLNGVLGESTGYANLGSEESPT